MQETNEQNFTDDVLNAPQSLVFIWAPWCHNCKAMTPHMEQMSREEKHAFPFFKLNGDENRALLKNYKIFGLPTILFFSHGRLVFRKTGAIGTAALSKKIEVVENISEEDAAAKEIKGLIRWPFKL